MSARDSESGSSDYKGGSGSAGGLGNGGVGGGRGGGGNARGGGGGGAGRNGGADSRTGLTTGNRWTGNTALGRPGGLARNPQAWGVRPQPTVSQAPLNRPTYPPSVQVPASVPGVNPVPQYPTEVPIPPSGIMFGDGSLWPGQGVTPPPQNDIPYGGLMFGNGNMWPGQNTMSHNPATYNPAGPGKQFYDRVPQDQFMSDASVSQQRRGW